MSAASTASPETANEKYFARLLSNKFKEEYVKHVAELAEKNPESFEISLSVNDGERWEKKTYQRQRITSSQYIRGEMLRGEYMKEREDLEKASVALGMLYKFLAKTLIGMPEEDFERTDWHEIKPILDSIEFRYIYSFPNIVSGKMFQDQQRQLLKRSLPQKK